MKNSMMMLKIIHQQHDYEYECYIGANKNNVKPSQQINIKI